MTKSIPLTFSQDIAAGNTKAAMKNVGASSGDLWRVPVDQFVVLPGLNVRSKSDAYEAHIESLKDSILTEGYFQDKPIAVYVDDQERIIVRDGHTRLEAVRRAIKAGAEIDTLPAVVSPRGTTMVDITVGLVKNNEGKPLEPIEKAVVFKRLIGWGWDEAKVAERFTVTEGYVKDLLRLLEAPEELKNLVSAGKVSAGTAIKQVKKEGAAEATKTLTEAVKASDGGKVSAKHLKKKANEGMALKPGETVKRKPTLKEAIQLLKDVWGDKHYTKLDEKTVAQIDFFFGDK